MPTRSARLAFGKAFRDLHASVRQGMLDRHDFPPGLSEAEQEKDADDIWVAALGVALTETLINAYGALRTVDVKTSLRELVEMAFDEAKTQCEECESEIAAIAAAKKRESTS